MNNDLIQMASPSGNEDFHKIFQNVKDNIALNNSVKLQTKRINYALSHTYENNFSEIITFIDNEIKSS